MKHVVIPTLAALALAACGDSSPADPGTEAEATATADAGIADSEMDGGNMSGSAAAPTATETVTIDTAPATPNSVTIDGRDVDATVSDDGVTAKIKVD